MDVDMDGETEDACAGEQTEQTEQEQQEGADAREEQDQAETKEGAPQESPKGNPKGIAIGPRVGLALSPVKKEEHQDGLPASSSQLSTRNCSVCNSPLPAGAATYRCNDCSCIAMRLNRLWKSDPNLKELFRFSGQLQFEVSFSFSLV